MTTRLYSLFHGWRVALLLVVVACASPGRVSAECGDHVVILNANATSQPDRASSPPAAEKTDLPALPKAPCTGPNCSRVPERHSLPFAPVSTSGPQAKEVAQLSALVTSTDCAATSFDDFISARPVRRATSIFHPPRIG